MNSFSLFSLEMKELERDFIWYTHCQQHYACNPIGPAFKSEYGCKRNQTEGELEDEAQKGMAGKTIAIYIIGIDEDKKELEERGHGERIACCGEATEVETSNDSYYKEQSCHSFLQQIMA